MSQFCQILEEGDGLKSGIIYQVNQIFTKKNGHLYKGRRICELLHDEDSGKKMHTIKAKYGGVVAKLLIKPGDVVSVGQPVLEIEACAHPTTLGNICCDCGLILEDNFSEFDANKTNGLVSMLHSIPDLKVSKEEAKRLGTEDINNLLENHKLVLLVDLDQTLIHTTNDNIPPKLKDVFHFQLAPNGPWYHTRLRPFANKFLQNMSKYYELHICTFGVREYAHCIAHFLDKDHKLFGDRILSRNECLDPLSKKANLRSSRSRANSPAPAFKIVTNFKMAEAPTNNRKREGLIQILTNQNGGSPGKQSSSSSLFPCGDNLVCIIDDRSDVWNFAPNVVQVMPYHFFQHTGDINAPPGLQKIENDDESKGYDFTKIGIDQDTTAIEKKETELTKTKSDVNADCVEDLSVATVKHIETGLSKAKEKTDDVEEHSITITSIKQKGEELTKSKEKTISADEHSVTTIKQKEADLTESKEKTNDVDEPGITTVKEKEAVLTESKEKTKDVDESIITTVEEKEAVLPESEEKPIVGDKNSVAMVKQKEAELTESKEKTNDVDEPCSDDSMEVTKKRKSDQINESKNKRSKTTLLDKKGSEIILSKEEESPKSMPSNLSSEISDSVTMSKLDLTQTPEDIHMLPLSNDIIKSEESTMSLVSSKNSDTEVLTKLPQLVCVTELDKDKKQLAIDICNVDKPVMTAQTSSSPTFGTSCKLVISCDDSQVENSPNSSDITGDDSQVQNRLNSAESTSAPKLNVSCKPNLNEESIKEHDLEGCTSTKINDSSLNGSLMNVDSSFAKDEKSDKESVQKESDSDVIDVEDSDDYLLYLEDILINLHKTFYNIYNHDKEKLPDLKQLVPESRQKVLIGTNIVFSGVIPRKTDLKDSKAFYIATSLGANVSENIIEKTSGNKNFTTHVIAANLHTEKVHIGKKFKYMKIVTPNWLWCCAERWEKVDERLFILDQDSEKVVCRNPPMHCCVNITRNESIIPSKIRSAVSVTPESEPSTANQWDSQMLKDSVNPLAYLSDDDAKSMEHEVDVELSDNDDNEVKEGDNDATDTDSEDSDGEESSKNNSEMDDCENDGLSKRRHSRTGADDDDEDDVEEDDEDEDELPSVRFRQGGTLSSEESDNEDDDDMNAYGDILAKELMD